MEFEAWPKSRPSIIFGKVGERATEATARNLDIAKDCFEANSTVEQLFFSTFFLIEEYLSV
jgi:hypothetical protein